MNRPKIHKERILGAKGSWLSIFHSISVPIQAPISMQVKLIFGHFGQFFEPYEQDMPRWQNEFLRPQDQA